MSKDLISNYQLSENYLLVGGGPVNCSLRTLYALAHNPILTPGYEIFEVISQVKRLLQHVFQTQNEATLAIQNSGSGGLEAAIINTVDPQEVIIVAVSGVWGERVADISRLRGIITVEIYPKETIFSLEELEEEIVKHKPVLLFLTHGESSSGLLQPLQGIGNMCHKYNCLLGIDAIATLGGVPVLVDEWNIDVVVSAPQKGARGLPGLSYLTFSPKAVKRIFSIKVKPPFYYNLVNLFDVWKCFDGHSLYYYTYNSNLLYAAREGLSEIAEQGILNVCDKNKRLVQQLWNSLEKLGFTFLVENPKYRLWTITCLYLPSYLSWSELNDFLSIKYKIFLGPDLHFNRSNVFRIGIMGYNAREEVIQYVLDKLQEALLHFQKQ